MYLNTKVEVIGGIKDYRISVIAFRPEKGKFKICK
jgi:hypothetical protein